MRKKTYKQSEDDILKVEDQTVAYKSDHKSGLSPTSYTLEELHKHLDQAEQDYKTGHYYTTEELFQIHPEWKID